MYQEPVGGTSDVHVLEGGEMSCVHACDHGTSMPVGEPELA